MRQRLQIWGLRRFRIPLRDNFQQLANASEQFGYSDNGIRCTQASAALRVLPLPARTAPLLTAPPAAPACLRAQLPAADAVAAAWPGCGHDRQPNQEPHMVLQVPRPVRLEIKVRGGGLQHGAGQQGAAADDGARLDAEAALLDPVRARRQSSRLLRQHGGHACSQTACKRALVHFTWRRVTDDANIKDGYGLPLEMSEAFFFTTDPEQGLGMPVLASGAQVSTGTALQHAAACMPAARSALFTAPRCLRVFAHAGGAAGAVRVQGAAGVAGGMAREAVV